MVEEEKDGFSYPEFSPNENPFITGQKNVTHKDEANKKKISKDIFDDDDSGDYAFLYWS